MKHFKKVSLMLAVLCMWVGCVLTVQAANGYNTQNGTDQCKDQNNKYIIDLFHISHIGIDPYEINHCQNET